MFFCMYNNVVMSMLLFLHGQSQEGNKSYIHSQIAVPKVKFQTDLHFFYIYFLSFFFFFNQKSFLMKHAVFANEYVPQGNFN